MPRIHLRLYRTLEFDRNGEISGEMWGCPINGTGKKVTLCKKIPNTKMVPNELRA